MVAEVDFVAKDVDVKEFPDILFALVGIESFFGGKPLPDFGQFL